ncbi:MAG: hypothetical protein ACK4RT_08655 [Erythrobacter sp.]
MHHNGLPQFGAILALLAAGPILAQQQPPRGGGLGPECRAQIIRLCGEDRAQRRACMKDKADELSDGCKAEIRQRMAVRRAMRPQGGAGQAPAPAPTSAPAPQH